jgi:hypothetical protein
MARTRRSLSGAFKAKVALAACRGDKTTAQLAAEYIHTMNPTSDVNLTGFLESSRIVGSYLVVPEKFLFLCEERVHCVESCARIRQVLVRRSRKLAKNATEISPSAV